MIDRGRYVRLTGGERRILVDLCRARLDLLDVAAAEPPADGPGREASRVARLRQRQLKRLIWQLSQAEAEPTEDTDPEPGGPAA